MTNVFVVSEGAEHPAQLSEGAGLANVKPPAITHKLKLMWDAGDVKMSKAQLLAVIYATQANNATYTHDNKTYRTGFLLGEHSFYQCIKVLLLKWCNMFII